LGRFLALKGRKIDDPHHDDANNRDMKTHIKSIAQPTNIE